jgi:hypothetical protein
MEGSMRSILGFSGVALLLAITTPLPVSGQAMKEGTTNGHYYAYGTVKINAVGKERVLISFDDNGLTLGQGLMDHMTLHCWGIGDFTNGMGLSHGLCTGMDPGGDQITMEFSENEKHTLDAKIWGGTFSYTGGTGKFAGITGKGTYVLHNNDFKPQNEGTYVVYNDYQASYKIDTPTQ